LDAKAHNTAHPLGPIKRRRDLMSYEYSSSALKWMIGRGPMISFVWDYQNKSIFHRQSRYATKTLFSLLDKQRSRDR